MGLFDHPVAVGVPNIGDRARFHELVDEILDRRQLTNNGPVVREFEERLASHLGVRNCVAVSNGTVALELAAVAMGLTGEVVVPSFTFVATAHALSWVGLRPVFCDIDPETLCIDPEAAAALITDETSAILGVHVYGRPCATAALAQLAERIGARLFYDAAHAFGCSCDGVRIGGFGACETFSFHATKFFNTFEGGAVVTNDDGLADELRRRRNFGFPAGSRESLALGTNAKMSEVCAAMGLVNLDVLDRVIEANRANYEAYKSALDPVPGIGVMAFDEREDSNYQYVVARVGDEFPLTRDDLVALLTEQNVFVQKYFWPGVHRMEPYATAMAHEGRTLPVTEAVAEEVVVLPTGLAVSSEDATKIATFIASLAEL